MKKFLLILIASLLILSSCSVDNRDRELKFGYYTVEVSSTDHPPAGGYWIYFTTNNIVTDSLFLSNGANGIDGTDGTNGNDGYSSTITVTEYNGDLCGVAGGFMIIVGSTNPVIANDTSIICNCNCEPVECTIQMHHFIVPSSQSTVNSPIPQCITICVPCEKVQAYLDAGYLIGSCDNYNQ